MDIQDYTTEELLAQLNIAAEDAQIEAKGLEDLFPKYNNEQRSTKANYKTLMESICAFSNEPELGGGVILLGVGEVHKNDEIQFVVEGLDNLTYRQMWNCETLKASSSLAKLRDNGFLIQKGRGSATYYIPGPRIVEVENTHGSPEMINGSAEMINAIQEKLKGLKKRLCRTKIECLIYELCEIKPFTRFDLTKLLGRREVTIYRHLRALLAVGKLQYTHPEMIKHPRQAYVAVKSTKEKGESCH